MKHKIILALSIAGVLFSGYLSSVKFFSQQCALGETCPIFLGQPACYFGFGMYLVLFVSSLLLVLHQKGLWVIRVVSALGILFAGYFTLGELPLLFSEGFGAYVMGLPTCAWGLIMYVAIFLLSLKQDRV